MESLRDIERILKGLANRRRLVVVKLLLKRKEVTVAAVAGFLNLSFKATSRHLAILRQLGIVENRQQGLYVYYRIAPHLPEVVRAFVKYISNSHE